MIEDTETALRISLLETRIETLESEIAVLKGAKVFQDGGQLRCPKCALDARGGPCGQAGCPLERGPA